MRLVNKFLDAMCAFYKDNKKYPTKVSMSRNDASTAIKLANDKEFGPAIVLNSVGGLIKVCGMEVIGIDKEEINCYE